MRKLTKRARANYEKEPTWPSLTRKRRHVPIEFPPDLADDRERAVTIRLRESMWARLDALSKRVKRPRNRVISHLLNWALDEYDSEMRNKEAAEQQTKKQPKK